MNLLRRLPLSRLLLSCIAVVVVGTGAALAATLGSGPTPPPASLADALHNALTAPPVAGVSAQISFSDNLVSSTELQSAGASGSGGGPGDGGPGGGGLASSPLITGADGRLWASSDGDVRLELQSDNGDTEITYDGQTLSLYDAASRTLYRLALPRHPTPTGGADHIPTVAALQSTLDDLMGQVDLSGAIPTDVAGQPTYELRISPKANGGLVGGAAVWWDAVHGVPLRLALYATGQTDPVLQLTATGVSYGPIAASVFALPPAAKTVDVQLPTGVATRHTARHGAVTGVAAVQAALPFTLAAPTSLAGLSLTGVRLVSTGSRPAALVAYGHGLAGIYVLERAAPATGSAVPTAGLPSVSVGGAQGQELATALGTLIFWKASGVSYTLVGSVTAAVAQSAASGL